MSAYDRALHFFRAMNAFMMGVALITEAVWLCM